MSCLICDRIAQIINNTNPYFVIELTTGYVVIGDHQRFRGYTLFLCKTHATELHELEHSYKMKYLEEMSLVAETVQKAFKADKINYELLGNGDSHLHWHLFPRRAGDTPTQGPVWWLPIDEMTSDNYRPTDNELVELKELLRNEIAALQSLHNPQKHDELEIRKTIQLFFDGFDNFDAEMIKRAFYSDKAEMFSVNENSLKLRKNQIKNWNKIFEDVRKDPNNIWNKEKSKKKIIYIDITGSAANAKVEYKFSEYVYTDYYNLIKADGSWYIVNKIFDTEFFKLP